MTIASEIQDLQTNLQSAKNAVTTKGGTVGDTGLAGLASEIATIPSGGGGGGGYLDPMDRVRFIDYDGTVIEQMSIEDANALSALPAVPTHDGLTGVGWTHSLAEIQATTRSLDVGAMYQNATNPRQSVFYLLPRANEAVTLNFSQDVSDGVTIDWGDGSAAETVSGTGVVTVSHTYATVDATKTPYKLTFTPDEGVTTALGGGTQSTGFFGNGSTFTTAISGIIGNSSVPNSAFYRCEAISTLVITTECTGIGNYVFSYNYNLKVAIIPNTISSIGTDVFSSCYNLSKVVFPSSITSVPNSTFNACSGLESFVTPASSTYIGGSAFGNCYGLKAVIVSGRETTIGSSAFSRCYNLESFEISSLAATIGQNAFSYCYSLRSATIPAAATRLNSNTFLGCNSLRVIKYTDRASMPVAQGVYFFTSGNCPEVIDCTEFTQVPSVISSFFGAMPAYTKILVPAALESQWKTANVWFMYASQIIGV